MPNRDRGNEFLQKEYEQFDQFGKNTAFSFLNDVLKWKLIEDNENYVDDGVMIDENGKQCRIEVECARAYRLKYILKDRTVHCSIKKTDSNIWLKLFQFKNEHLILLTLTENVLKSPTTSFMKTRDSRVGESRFYKVPLECFSAWVFNAESGWHFVEL